MLCKDIVQSLKLFMGTDQLHLEAQVVSLHPSLENGEFLTQLSAKMVQDLRLDVRFCGSSETLYRRDFCALL